MEEEPSEFAASGSSTNSMASGVGSAATDSFVPLSIKRSPVDDDEVRLLPRMCGWLT